MQYKNDFKYDLQIGQAGERQVGELLSNKTIEVKRDFWMSKSGNIAIEYESWGKPSGLATTQAEWWAIIAAGELQDKIIIFIETEHLKKIARYFYQQGNIKSMGDNNTSKAVLIPIRFLLFIKH